MPQTDRTEPRALSAYTIDQLGTELISTVLDLDLDEDTVRHRVDEILGELDRRHPASSNGDGSAALDGS